MATTTRYTDRQKQLIAVIDGSKVDGVHGVLPGYALSLDEKTSHYYRAAQSLSLRGRIARREINGKVYWFSTP